MNASAVSHDVQASFDALQERLVPLWRSIRELSLDPQTIVVVPSISIDLVDSAHIPMQTYEERMLFMLLLLRQPRARLVFVTSQPIQPSTIDYYLGLVPGVDRDDARARLFPVAVLDGSSRPLTEKLLERPRSVARVRDLVLDAERAHLVPFVATALERELALRLGVPMYAADPRHAHFGTKSGGRRLFAEEGVAHPRGAEGLHDLDAVVATIARLRTVTPELGAVLVKLDEGVAGDGNALVRFGVPEASPSALVESTRAAVESMRLEADDLTIAEFARRLAEWGGVVEERVEGSEFASPSVQMRVTPLGELEVLSTHDQLLGGPDGQSYVGCVFPADPRYAALITDAAAAIGRRLAREGVIGRFAVDFVVVRDVDGAWMCAAIEINLRKGGTTHPFLTLQFLTDGSYDAVTATFRTPAGAPKCFVASDNIESSVYRQLTPDDVFETFRREGLHFDRETETGVVAHMLAGLTERGRLGMTAIADDPDAAHELFDRARAGLDAEAALASVET
ncbi:MAG: peptide ligase PGM1-related protein [Acidimicrobiia bacterium]